MARAHRSNNKNEESLASIALIGLAYAVILFFQNANMVFIALFVFSVLQTIAIVINSTFKIYQEDEESLYENFFFLFLVGIGLVMTYILAKFVPTDLVEIYKDYKITDFIFGKKLTSYGVGFENYERIVEATCEAWLKFTEQTTIVKSLTARNWAIL